MRRARQPHIDRCFDIIPTTDKMRRSSLQQFADGTVGHQDDRPANRVLLTRPNDEQPLK
jgi:hypothetical protein